MTYKGRFTPKNPSKYKGDPTKVIYRSSWEARVMKYLDENPNVLQWQSEEVIVPYVSPIDGKYHRYFPDFVIKIRDKYDNIAVKMIEIKPSSQSKPPQVKQKGQRTTRKYLQEVMTWGVNQAKWTAATEYCADRKWQFVVLTEKDLNL